MRIQHFTADQVDRILRSSEGRPTGHRGGRDGHAGSRHFLLSNAELVARYEEQVRREQERRAQRRAEAAARGERYRPGGAMYITITAFATMPDMVEAGVQVLNSRQAQAGLTAMFIGEYAAEGSRLEINFPPAPPVRMRCANDYGVATMPATQLTMIVDRVRDRPQGLHVQTFFGGTPLGAERNRAILYGPNGQARLGFLGE